MNERERDRQRQIGRKRERERERERERIVTGAPLQSPKYQPPLCITTKTLLHVSILKDRAKKIN